MMESTDLTVVLGTYNRLQTLIKSLDALIGKIKTSHEIIVVDAGSTDGTLEYLEQLAGIRLVKDEKRNGQAQSLNRVFRTLKSKYTCWLSDDNIILGEILSKAVSILEKHPDIGMLGLKVKDVTGPYTDRPYMGAAWSPGILNCNQGMLPTQLLQKLGGFAEEFRDYGIDADLTMRVLLAGYKVALTRNIAIHHYRDHENSGWIDVKTREQRLQRARELYLSKYDALIQSKYVGSYNKGKQLRSRSLNVIRKIYYWGQQRNLPVEKWLGVSIWDWQNLFLGRFISRLDFVIHRFSSFYLVQSIPKKILALTGDGKWNTGYYND
jgi:GT2 family glycosyltransferase